MKSLILIPIFLFSTFLWGSSELLDRHQEICRGHKQQNCRVLIIPQNSIDKIMKCSGLLVGRFECTVSMQEGNAMNLTCGDPSNPILYQDFKAIEFNYKVAAIIQDEKGSDRVISDDGVYTVISNNLMKVNLYQTKEELTHSITLDFPSDGTPLENLVCE